MGTILYILNRKFQQNYKKLENFDHPPAHDPCAVFYLLERSALKDARYPSQ